MTTQLTNALKELKGFQNIPKKQEILDAADGTTFSGKNWSLKKNNNTSYNVHCGQ